MNIYQLNFIDIYRHSTQIRRVFVSSNIQRIITKIDYMLDKKKKLPINLKGLKSELN